MQAIVQEKHINCTGFWEISSLGERTNLFRAEWDGYRIVIIAVSPNAFVMRPFKSLFESFDLNGLGGT